MSEWLNQFTSSYASSIAYALSVLILSIVFKPILLFLSKQIKRYSEIRRLKQQDKIIVPTKKDVQRYSSRIKISENEWNDALAFLKNDIPILCKDFGESDVPGEKIISFLDKHARTYQITIWGLLLIDLVANAINLHWLQIISRIIWIVLLSLLTIVIAFAFIALFIYKNQQKVRVNKLKSQMRNAMNALVPSVIFTYGQLGEFLKSTKKHDLPWLQAELSDIGMTFRLEDMNFAYYLVNTPIKKLLPMGEEIAKKVIPQDKFSTLSRKDKKEISHIFLKVIQNWPVSLQNESKTSNT